MTRSWSQYDSLSNLLLGVDVVMKARERVFVLYMGGWV